MIAASKQRDNGKRQWDRLAICMPMFVKWTDEQRRLRFRSSPLRFNICAGGAFLAMRRHVPLGTKLHIEIPCAPTTGKVLLRGAVHQFTAEVVHVEQRKDAHLVGVSFAVSKLTTRHESPQHAGHDQGRLR